MLGLVATVNTCTCKLLSLAVGLLCQVMKHSLKIDDVNMFIYLHVLLQYKHITNKVTLVYCNKLATDLLQLVWSFFKELCQY